MPTYPPSRRGRFLQLTGLSSLALTQPLLDLLRASPELLVAHRATPSDLLLIAVLPTLLPVVVVLTVEFAASRLSRSFARWIHNCSIGLLVALLVLGMIRGLPLGSPLAIGLAALGGVAAGWGVQRTKSLSLWLSYLWPAALVVPLVFWLSPGISALWPDIGGRPVGATPEGAAGAGSTVVVVIFDELPVASLSGPDGGLDRQRLPSFADFACSATLYPRAYSVSDFTVQAVPAILTGRYPRSRRLPIAAHHRDSLFRLLAASHRMNVVESVTQLCPVDICAADPGSEVDRRLQLADDLGIVLGHRLLPTVLSAKLPPIQLSWGHFAGSGGWLAEWRRRGRADRLDQVARFLAAIDNPSLPTLHFLHVLLPHPPFNYLPSGKIFSAAPSIPGLEGERWGKETWPITQARQRHLLQVGLVDRVLGQILARLRHSGVYDSATVVVTADHGVSHQPGGYRRHLAPENAAQILAVPLWIKAPGQQRAKVDDRLVESVDILPTVAALQGIELPWQTDGRSLTVPWSRSHITVFPHRQHGERSLQLTAAELEVGAELQINDPFALGPHPELVGRRLEDLELGPPSQLTTALELPVSTVVVGRPSPYAAALVNGRIFAPDNPPMPALAVAVAGIVRAVTQITSGTEHSFSALVGDQAFTSAQDAIRVFAVTTGPEGLQLRSIAERNGAEGHGGDRRYNLVSSMLGLEHDGFFAAERWSEGVVRWTDGDARITIPIDPRLMPRALHLKILKSGPRGARLRITANGNEIFDQWVPRIRGTSWQRRVSLAGLAPADQLELRLRSGTHIPRREFHASDDGRRLGLALHELRLD